MARMDIAWAGTVRRAAIRTILLNLSIAPFLACAGDGHNPGSTAAASAPIPVGSWGGAHIRLDLAATGAELEFDCAVGRIDEPLLATADGSFHAQGVVMRETGGPIKPGQPSPPPRAARFDGWTDGREMRLTITFLAGSDQEFGTFTLGLGRRAHLEKCL